MPPARLRVSVVALFIDGVEPPPDPPSPIAAPAVLLLHQMTGPAPDCWDLPGGGLAPTETLISGLRREVREETGITHFTVDGLLTVAEEFFDLGTELLHTLNLVYRCRVQPRPTQFSPTDINEIGPKGIRWWPVDQLVADQCSPRAWAGLAAAALVAPGP